MDAETWGEITRCVQQYRLTNEVQWLYLIVCLVERFNDPEGD